jgi:hypothetical protein
MFCKLSNYPGVVERSISYTSPFLIRKVKSQRPIVVVTNHVGSFYEVVRGLTEVQSNIITNCRT